MDEELLILARAVETAVFESLLLAERNPEQATKWFAHAQLLETKFKNKYNKHYTEITMPDLKVTFI